MGKRALKIILDGYGSYLSMERGCYVVKDKHGNIKRYPMFETDIGEVVLKSGNMVSTGAIASLGFWEIPVLFLTRKGRPIAHLKYISDDAHVKTRIHQYESLSNGKGFNIAKQIVIAKVESQNIVLKKYELKLHNKNAKRLVEGVESGKYRMKLLGIEGKYSSEYFKQIFKLFPEKFRPKVRRKFQAYDGLNNVFNLAYEILSWQIQKSLISAKLDPFCGFLHSLAHGKPSLLCDLKEVYRYIIDDFLIQYCQDLRRKDFILKTETVKREKKGKREYLNEPRTREMLEKLYGYLETKVEVPRIKFGESCSIETLISEECLLLAQFLRGRKKKWIPRIANL